ncbi:SgcJ/EcaC family oxidoreductase [Spiractinospora alimapuensis]|uniref:SgcJ/EcaC family oxidoreductase n=1 Tax=Spiractinospora alimapuensis TaxID=2820884 RepID=UPI001F273D06|nr:SgcJ/EcaC family oxidoreductase [Spiractinospora alimapuensis]QVQ53750.1 SgcJ/EcaC family oxidoreductase [Spiractinospora alimapuensis]
MDTAPDREADIVELDELLRRQITAWAKDGAAFAATFTEDADFIAVDGSHLRGRAEITESLREGFEGFMANTRMSAPRSRTVRFPTPDMAVMITSGVCILQPGEEECRPETLSIQTRTALRLADGWRFTTFHNSRMWNSHTP